MSRYWLDVPLKKQRQDGNTVANIGHPIKQNTNIWTDEWNIEADVRHIIKRDSIGISTQVADALFTKRHECLGEK